MGRKIVFLVYKPGWWGCMDKMYREYKAKAGWDCTVIVLPRYAKAPEDGHVLREQVEYAPQRMPEYVKLTDYRHYSLEEQKPDKIVIHNPFDGMNPLDTVEKCYYSESLKGMTRELIYIPYMLYRDWLPQEEKNYPVYNFADTIYIPTEKMRYQFDACYDDKLKAVDCGIAEYLERLRKRACQGKGKERRFRLLYSVNFADLYYNTDRQISKMEEVFCTLADRKDIDFIFRPNEDILRLQSSLSPQIRQAYGRLLQRFLEQKIGRVDVSEDPYAAAAEADAFMGSGMNLISNLFAVQGKRRLLLGVQCFKELEENERIPEIYDSVVENNTVSFVTSYHSNFLCRLDLETGEVKTLCGVPTGQFNGCFSLWKEKGKYWFLLDKDKMLVSYDEAGATLEKIYVPIKAADMLKRIFAIVPFEDYFYLLSGETKSIWRFDLQHKTFSEISGWARQLEELALPGDRSEPMLHRKTVQEGVWLHIPSAMANAVLHLRMDTGEYTVEKIGEQGDKYFALWKRGEKLLLLPYKGKKIYLRDEKSGSEQVIYEIPEKRDMVVPYGETLEWKDSKVLLFPWQAEKILEVDMETGAVREAASQLELSYPEECPVGRRFGYGMVKRQGERILTYNKYTGLLRVLDSELHIQKEIPLRLPPEQIISTYIQRVDSMIRQYSPPGEAQEWFSLPVMLEYLKHGDK